MGSILLAALLQAQPQPDANTILRKVSERYSAAKSLEIEETIHVTTRRERDGEVTREKTDSVNAAFVLPDKFMATGPEVVHVTDGKQAWGFSAALSEYWSDDPEEVARAFDSGRKMVDQFRYSELIQAKLLREERIGEHSCYVIEVHAPWTSEAGDLEWVDKVRLVVLRRTNALTTGGIITTARFDYTVKLDQPLPESLFQFVPPPGAKQVQRSSR